MEAGVNDEMRRELNFSMAYPAGVTAADTDGGGNASSACARADGPRPSARSKSGATPPDVNAYGEDMDASMHEYDMARRTESSACTSALART